MGHSTRKGDTWVEGERGRRRSARTIRSTELMEGGKTYLKDQKERDACRISRREEK